MEGWGSQRETRRCKRGTHVGSKTEQPRDLREYEAYFFFVSRHFSISFLLFHLLVLLICNSYATLPNQQFPFLLILNFFFPNILFPRFSLLRYFIHLPIPPIFLQFPLPHYCSNLLQYHPSHFHILFFFQRSFPLFTTSSSQSSNSNLPSSHLISTLPRPLFLPPAIIHFSLFSLSLSLSIPVLSRLTSSTPPLLPLTQTRRKTREPMPPRRWIMDFERSHASYPRLNIHNAFLRHVIRFCTIQPRSTGRARARETPRHRVWTNDDNRCIHGNNTVVHRGVDDTGKLLLLLFLFGACCFEYEIIRAETTRGSRPTFTVWIWSHLATRLLVHVFLLD